MKSDLQCPIDFVPMNENKARVTAFFVMALAIAFWMSGLWAIYLFLLIDFALRAFNIGKYSLLAFCADAVIKQLKIKNKPVDRGPKRFAAGVGMIFSAAILACWPFHQNIIALILNGVLIVFAFLESILAFCAGCYVYTIGLRLKQLFVKQPVKN